MVKTLYRRGELTSETESMSSEVGPPVQRAKVAGCSFGAASVYRPSHVKLGAAPSADDLRPRPGRTNGTPQNPKCHSKVGRQELRRTTQYTSVADDPNPLATTTVMIMPYCL